MISAQACAHGTDPQPGVGNSTVVPARSVLMLNSSSDFSQSVGQSLERAGHRLCYLSLDRASAISEYPSEAVLFPWPAPSGAVQDVDVDQFVYGLENMLATAGEQVRQTGLLPGTTRLSRLVIVSGWEVNGGISRTCMAAASGALLGLARSWALEFQPLGITVNAVVPGPEFMSDRYKNSSVGRANLDDLTYAIRFFLDPRAHAISGQVLAVCAGRSPATVPI